MYGPHKDRQPVCFEALADERPSPLSIDNAKVPMRVATGIMVQGNVPNLAFGFRHSGLHLWPVVSAGSVPRTRIPRSIPSTTCAVASAVGAWPDKSAGRKATAATERKQHKHNIHVDQNDPAVMRLALANSRNATEPYAAMGDVCDKPHADNPIPAVHGSPPAYRPQTDYGPPPEYGPPPRPYASPSYRIPYAAAPARPNM